MEMVSAQYAPSGDGQSIPFYFCIGIRIISFCFRFRFCILFYHPITSEFSSSCCFRSCILYIYYRFCMYYSSGFCCIALKLLLLVRS
ncbi:hypothetical protein BJ165DRAFT_1518184 [Panaeolus papilionaceus]|nr:hypothetical protein BJ165DRAFT_1518184 [Panaeolus papilionaceus]